MEHIIHLNGFVGRISKDRKRVGRGIGSGKGNTAGAGHKGQSARSGTSAKRRNAEFARRFPKFGFTSHKPRISILTLDRLNQLVETNQFDVSKQITIKDLANAGVNIKNGLKLIGNTEAIKPIKIAVNAASQGAKDCLEKFGASLEIVGQN